MTPRLVAGSVVFGVGWGLVGLCPGPALVLLGLGGGGWREAATFVLAMAGGLLVGLRWGRGGLGSSGAGPVERGAGLG